MAKREQQAVPENFPPEEGGTPTPHTPLQALASEVQRAQASAVADATMADVGEQGQVGEPGPTALPNAPLVAQMIGAVRDTVCMLAGLEAPKRTLTDEKVDKLGEIWGGVLDHYGIQLSKQMGKFGPIIVAAVASAPLLRDTVMETRAEIIAKDATKPAVLPAPAAAPGLPIPPAPPAPTFTEGQIRPAFPS